ncbi:MAG: zinc ribbon domain-containing protein, partial [Solirubrobacterales bacterium]
MPHPVVGILARSMPIYEYKCPDGHAFEVVQSMSDDPVTVCEVC